MYIIIFILLITKLSELSGAEEGIVNSEGLSSQHDKFFIVKIKSY